MVQFFTSQAPQRTPGLGDILGQAVGQGLQSGIGAGFQQAQQRGEQERQSSMLGSALQEVQQIYNSNLPQQQKTIAAYKLLSSRPEVAQALTKQLSDQESDMQSQQVLNQLYPSQGTPSQGIPGQQNNPSEQQPTIPQEDQLYSEELIGRLSASKPEVAKQLREHNKQVLKNKQHREKIQQEEKQFFHKETAKLDESLSEQATAAEKKNRALARQMVNIDKINWWDRAVSSLFSNTPFGDLLKSETAQEFDANTLPQMEGLRQILGGVLSDSDIRLILQKVVTSSKNPEANKKIAKWLTQENDLVIAKKRIGDEIKKRNGGYRPANYEEERDRVFYERYGKDIQEGFQDIMSLKDDKKKLEKIGRRKVPPGTPLSERVTDMYLDMADGDFNKAAKMANEDGYDF